jgi:site-specific recombinase XerD
VAVKRAARDPLLRLVESYINDHLRRVRGASPHTVRAYGHALRLFFIFLARHTGRPIAKLGLGDITVDGVLGFLSDLESARRNTSGTRNCRLAAVRGLVEHPLMHDLERAGQYQRVLAIRSKKTKTRVIDYLEPEHVRALLAEPDRRTARSTRDYALLVFLYNTGARISEALAVTPADLHLAPPRHVRLPGQRSQRAPLPAMALDELRRWLEKQVASQRARRRAPARSIPSMIKASSAASMLVTESLPSAEKVGQKRPTSSRFVHIAKPLRSQYTMRTRSRRLEKKINR